MRPDGERAADELAPVIEAVWQSLRAQGLSRENQRLGLHVLMTRTETELPDEGLSGT